MNAEERRVEFARVFAKHDRWLYAYLVTLLGNPADAEEVFQEVCVVLWREYEVFDTSTNFMKWASAIAHHQVLRFRRIQGRRERQLSEVTLELVVQDAVEEGAVFESRRTALHRCLQKLPPSDRDVVAACYAAPRRSFKEAATELGRPENTVYKALQRIRRALHLCIDRQIAAEA